MEGIDSFGAWVRDLRTTAGLTQRELAERSMCAPITIRKIEADERRPSRQTAGLLADALGVVEDERDRFIAVARGELSVLRLRTVGSGIHRPLTPLLGRNRELDDLIELASFAGGDARLITLTGPPGVGKTRLALEFADRARRKFDLSVITVDLSSVDDPDQVWPRILAAVSVPLGPSLDREEPAVRALSREECLLVVDNFEQVLGASNRLTHLLERVPTLTCVVTCRSPIGVYGEWLYPVGPLELPSPGQEPTTVRNARTWPALELFVQRANAGRVRLSDGEVAFITEVCRRLDGLPLAIEIAAALARRMSMEELARRVQTDMSALVAPERDRPPRQASVRAAVGWSYSMVAEETRLVLRAAAACVGPFHLDRLAAVAGGDIEGTTTALDELVAHGLIAFDGLGEYNLLTVVRAFAAGESSRDERQNLARRHALRMAVEAEESAAAIEAWSNQAVIEAFDDAFDDLVAALEWSLSAEGDSIVGCRLLVALGPYLFLRGHLERGMSWFEQAMASGPPDDLHVPLAFFHAEGVFGGGAVEVAAELFEQAERRARAIGDTRWLPQILGDIGMIELIRGDAGAAIGPLEESVRLSRAAGTSEGQALSHMRLSRLAMLQGDLERAADENERAGSLYAAAGDRWGIGSVEANRGDVGALRGDFAAALDSYLRAFDEYLDGGFDWYAASRLESVASCLAMLERHHAAAAVFGAADTWLSDLGMPPSPVSSLSRADAESATRKELGSAFDRFAEVGAGRSRDSAGLRELVAMGPPGVAAGVAGGES